MTDFLQANVQIFRTDHILNTPVNGYDWKFSPASLVYYPFDWYYALFAPVTYLSLFENMSVTQLKYARLLKM